MLDESTRSCHTEIGAIFTLPVEKIYHNGGMDMNELIHKDHFLQMMAATEVAPAALKTELSAQAYGKLPWGLD